MSIAIMSDFHANLEATEAVFRDRDSLNRQGRGITKTYCLGDLVDYGANPREVIDLVRRECDLVLTGNHDIDVSRRKLPRVLYGGIANTEWESNTVDITNWTRKQLSQKSPQGLLETVSKYAWGGAQTDHLQYLASLPFIHREGDSTFVHAAPLEGFYHQLYFRREFILDFLVTAEVHFDIFLDDIFKNMGRMCFIGHTHVPVVTTLDEDKNMLMSYVRGSQTIPLHDEQKAIVNVGSVGQPRDSDYRACYVVLDGETVEFRRVEYDVDETVRKIKEAKVAVDRLNYYRKRF